MNSAMQALMKELLENANIPALSFSWYQRDIRRALAYGVTNTLLPETVDNNTLFQAASLSKPVSSAIILDLVDQGKWNLNTPLAKLADYGPEELQQYDYYHILTTRMVIGQCSGLANYGNEGDDGTKFITPPNTQFNYSGVAFDFLQQVVEKKLQKTWEEVAQDFFKRAGMHNSTFIRQLPNEKLHDKHRLVASAHLEDPLAENQQNPLPPLPNNVRGITAGAMQTTAKDYILFLQYCFTNNFMKSKLLTPVLSGAGFPPLDVPNAEIQWGLGMGFYLTNNKSIAFHWGNNTGSISFCAMNMATGDAIACFANSGNGVAVFEALVKPVVGDLTPLFQWLKMYCNYKDEHSPKAPDQLAESIPLIYKNAVSDFFKPAPKQSKNDIEINNRSEYPHKK